MHLLPYLVCNLCATSATSEKWTVCFPGTTGEEGIAVEAAAAVAAEAMTAATVEMGDETTPWVRLWRGVEGMGPPVALRLAEELEPMEAAAPRGETRFCNTEDDDAMSGLPTGKKRLPPLGSFSRALGDNVADWSSLCLWSLGRGYGCTEIADALD